MLEELKRLDSPGTSDAILFFLKTIASHDGLSKEDLYSLCAHTPGQYQINLDAMILYCKCFNFITGESVFSLEERLIPFLLSDEKLTTYLVNETVSQLFCAQIILPTMFTFDLTNHHFQFHNEKLALCYSAIRNILASQGLFSISRKYMYSKFFIAPEYEGMIASYCSEQKKTMSLKQLQQKLEHDADVGALAEKFVLEYEQERISSPLATRIKIISDIDVTAGYDIISFNSSQSVDYDRFIEVKAISDKEFFFWSRNEFETAKIKGSQYYLYLVHPHRINDENYTPIIISNPAVEIFDSTEWLLEPQSYKIQKVFF